MLPLAFLSLLLFLIPFGSCHGLDDPLQSFPRHNSPHHRAAQKIQARAPALVSGWVSKGCYTDSSSKRALQGYSTSSTTANTPNGCINTCKSKGYTYAGTEIGRQCFCSNKITTSTSPTSGQSVSSSQCNTPCTGDKTQMCGAANRLTIYTYAPALPSGWKDEGCWTDSTTNRALKGYSTTSATNTPTSCANTCAGKGYTLAGVSGTACYCSDTIVTSATAALASSQCTTSCPGSPTQICGGSTKLSVFSSAGAPIISTSTWKSIGCYVDGTPRALQGPMTTSNTNTVASCTSGCAAKGYPLAGVEWGVQCFCGNKIVNTTTVGIIKADSECAMPCPGDATKSCGNGNRIAVYSASTAFKAQTPPVPPETVPSGWERVGCFTDSVSSRALKGYSVTSASNGPYFCMTTCAAKGYMLSGMEYGTECYCSNSISTSSTGQLTADSDCSMPCAGSPTSKCGNGNRLDVWGTAAWRSQSTTSYQIAQTYQGQTFFDQWTFITAPDLTNGVVDYQSEDSALSSGLISVNDAGNAIMRVETTPIVAGNRQSVRIESEASFTGGILIGDFVHMPTGCGTWPAFWSYGPNWPSSGEIDIVEDVHQTTENIMTIHTSPGCTMPTNYNATGTLNLAGPQGTNCDPLATGGSGCGIISDVPNNFGAPFNANGGGLYAMVWDDSGISVNFWPRGSIPADISLGAPRPDTWPLPAARWPASTCDPSTFFKNHVIVFDTTLCGDWAGNTWSAPNQGGQADSCQAITGYPTCAGFVQANGAAFAEAYWEVKSVKLYQSS